MPAIVNLEPRYRRRGLTLIEMLVVMTIIVILSSLAVAFVPKLQEKSRASDGAGQVQGYLMISKQWALRDQAPRGIRLQPDANNLVTVLQYIEQPLDFTGGQVSVTGTAATANAGSVDFFGGYGGGDTTSWPVQPGDYLEVHGQQLFQISAVNGANSLTLTAGPASPIGATTDYRIVRQARPRSGEAAIELPPDVAIDLTTNTMYNNPLPINNTNANSIDILFAPSGEVIQGGGASSMIQLWVRNTTDAWVNQTFPGDQTLITIYRRTGMVSSNPVDTNLNPNNPTQYANPYSFTQDGQGSGM